VLDALRALHDNGVPELAAVDQDGDAFRGAEEANVGRIDSGMASDSIA